MAVRDLADQAGTRNRGVVKEIAYAAWSHEVSLDVTYAVDDQAAVIGRERPDLTHSRSLGSGDGDSGTGFDDASHTRSGDR